MAERRWNVSAENREKYVFPNSKFNTSSKHAPYYNTTNSGNFIFILLCILDALPD